MEQICNTSQMKFLDNKTINTYQLPSLVLIENAANSVARYIKSKYSKNTKICIFAGDGNNGADAICLARILTDQKYDVGLYVISTSHKKSEDCKRELEIAKHYHVNFIEDYEQVLYDLIVDGIFGIGLNKEVENEYAICISYINQSQSEVISLDIPSGINGNTGSVMGVAVRADNTITFAYKKLGLLLNEGPNYSGIVHCEYIGVSNQLDLNEMVYTISYNKEELPFIEKRIVTGNKGTFGKIALFAGSKEYGGAVILSSLAAFRMGGGMIHVITHSENKPYLLAHNPEAIITCYDQEFDFEKFESILSWADVIAMGPGIGFEKNSFEIFEKIIEHSTRNRNKPMVIDADALTMLANNDNYLFQLLDSKQIICTPHVKEFSRLTGNSIQEIKENTVKLVSDFSIKWNLIIVCKDAKTFIYDGKIKKSYINQSGNSGMATAGSGDVLTGIIASLLASGMPGFEAAYKGVHIHGLAGDAAYINFGTGLIATDIINTINNVI